jgi:hypothetical protein
VPRLPPAPGRFWMMNGWPSRSDSHWPIRCAVMSVPSEGEAGLAARGSLHWPSQMFLTLASSDLAQARAHDGWRRDGGKRAGQGLGVHGAPAERRGSINNTTGTAVTRPGRVTAFAETRRSNDTKAAGRHLSPRSGDAGQDAGPTSGGEPSPVDPTDRLPAPDGNAGGIWRADPLVSSAPKAPTPSVTGRWSAHGSASSSTTRPSWGAAATSRMAVDLFTVPPTSRSKPCQRRHDAANTQRAP